MHSFISFWKWSHCELHTVSTVSKHTKSFTNNSNVHMDLTYFVWKNNYDILWRGLYKHKHSLHAVFSFQLCLSLKFQQDLHLLCFFNLFILWVCPHSASLSFCPSCLCLITPGCFPRCLIWCPNPLVSLFIFQETSDYSSTMKLFCEYGMANQFIKMYAAVCTFNLAM